MDPIKMKWLDGRVKGGITSFGVPHKRGEVRPGESLAVTQNGIERDAAARPIAYWDDGSVKWTSVTAELTEDEVEVKTGRAGAVAGIEVTETDSAIIVKNGGARVLFHRSGTVMADGGGFVISVKAVKTLISDANGIRTRTDIPYYADIEECYVEQADALRTVICMKGRHKAADNTCFLRYIVRFILYRDSNRVDIKHTFIYDGDASTDFIGGMAVEIRHKMCGSMFNRRVKIAGDSGFMHEPLQLLNLSRPRLEASYYEAQLRGENVDVGGAIDLRTGEPCADRIGNATVWDSFKYMQLTPDSYTIRKRTAHSECAYINAGFGRRAKGLLYAGGENGGIAVGMRHFFEKAPSAIDVSGLSADECVICAWIHPADAAPLDMRHYDTVSHNETYYEGFPWVGSDPYGIAATNELSVFCFGRTPEDNELLAAADTVTDPSVLICEPEQYRATRVLGEFSLPDRSAPFKAWLEGELDKAVDFYMREIEQRHWYGLFDYGDVMHTYDSARHCWRYDMGGFAWQNTELVPTLWLWYAFLRSGRGDIFNFAEAMSRHAADVDVYHIGDKKGIGSRHNVLHWGDSCKEPRISMAGHHRALYYIMGGDLRIGDVFDDVIDADYSAYKDDPIGSFHQKGRLPSHARTGPDWSSYCSNWYTEWERRQNTKYRDKIQVGIDDLKKAPLRMVSGTDFEYDPETGHLGYIGEVSSGGEHLAICMGGPQTWMELAELLGDNEFRDMLIEYGKFYYLSPEQKRAASNGLKTGDGFPFPYMAAALAGYAARETDDEQLARQVWQELISEIDKSFNGAGFETGAVQGYYNNPQLREITNLSTNFTAQWCLNVIMALEYIKDYMP